MTLGGITDEGVPCILPVEALTTGIKTESSDQGNFRGWSSDQV